MHKCVNNSTANLYHLEQFVSDFFPYSQKQLGFDKPVTIKFESDDNNASTLLGKTAYYDPDNLEVTLFVDGRHPKDVMRSLSHELVHHAQNCRGDFNNGCEKEGWHQACVKDTDPGYAQRDPHLRKMEREAYTKGNLIFRDFEDLIKTGKIEVHIDFKNSGEPKMSLQEWKNNEINQKLMKKWGLLKESQNGEVHPWDVHFEPDDRSPEALKHFARDYLANRGRVPFEVIDYFKSIGLDGNHEALLSIAKTGVIPGENLNEDSKEEDCGCEDLEEGNIRAGAHYRGIGKKDSVNMKGYKYSGLRDVKAEVLDRKISVREAKALTRRILEHIQKGDK